MPQATAGLDVSGRSGGPRRRRPRRLAAVRFPRAEPHRRRNRRRRPRRRTPGDAPLVLPHPRIGRAARPRARHRARRARPPAGHEGAVRGPRRARSRTARAAPAASAASRWSTRRSARFPYIARVDAGTVELVRQMGVDVVSSGDLVQRFATIWDDAALETHRRASEALYRIKDRAFDAVARRLASGTPTTEYDIQQLMTGWFRDEGLVSDSPPIVAAQENAGNPHYMPTAAEHRAIRPGRDRAARPVGQARPRQGRVRRHHVGRLHWRAGRPSATSRCSRTVAAARDAAVALVTAARPREGRELRGWQVDRAASSVLRGAGYGAHVLHRTGHSLGESVHGNGVNMDDYETHDDRRLLAGHRLHDRTGPLLRRLRRAIGNQHDRPRPRRQRDRTAAEQDCGARLGGVRCPPASSPCCPCRS